MEAPATGAPERLLAPVLETARLRLRPHRADDLDALHAIWSDPEVCRHLGGEPATRQDAWMRLLRYAGLWPMLGHGYWAIEENASGRLLGDIGYADFMRDLTPPLGDMPEMGWVLASTAHGKGFASEALAAISRWGNAHFGAHRDVCIIAPANAASIHLAEKAGFHAWYDSVLHDAPIRVFVREIVSAAG